MNRWSKHAIEFVVAIYKVTETFPKDEKFALTSLLRRAAVSIVPNISEGAARRTTKEFRQFLSHSTGSASEVDTELARFTIHYSLFTIHDEFSRQSIPGSQISDE
ncbi:MAG TPA: four helix bundle protein [Pyrinomonadaceae bacterium]